jgi:two-component system C4-dicarboxylate transport response regulator DctD
VFRHADPARVTQSRPIEVALVEDDTELRHAAQQALAIEGFVVHPFAGAEAALAALSPEFDGVVVSDIRMPRIDGLELFARLTEMDAELPVILVTGHGDVPMAVEAMKRGAADFLTKPFATSRLADAVRRAATRRALVIENRRLREALRDRTIAGMLGTSDAVKRLDRLVTQVARTDIDVHVAGDPGMGKSHLARRIHELSPRSDRPLVTIDVGIWSHSEAELLIFGRDRAAGLSRSGLVERARGGTLLLDDAEAIPDSLRGRIRTLLEKRTINALGAERPQTIDVRVIVALADEGRQDSVRSRSLLDRLGGVTIAIPPLSDRREDVSIIFRHFVDQFERELGAAAATIGPDQWAFLLHHDWPGGLREVRDFARAFVLGLGAPAGNGLVNDRGGSSLRDLASAFERTVLEDAMHRTSGNVAAVQALLQVKRKTLYEKLNRHGLTPKRFR